MNESPTKKRRLLITDDERNQLCMYINICSSFFFDTMIETHVFINQYVRFVKI